MIGWELRLKNLIEENSIKRCLKTNHWVFVTISADEKQNVFCWSPCWLQCEESTRFWDSEKIELKQYIFQGDLGHATRYNSNPFMTRPIVSSNDLMSFFRSNFFGEFTYSYFHKNNWIHNNENNQIIKSKMRKRKKKVPRNCTNNTHSD